MPLTKHRTAQVSLAAGALVELLGSLLCFLAGAVLAELPSTAARPQLSLCLESAAGVTHGDTRHDDNSQFLYMDYY